MIETPENASVREARRLQLASRTATLAPYPTGFFEGAGIVICAGGAALFTNAYVLIHVLRRELKCALPIEVWHFGGEMSERMLFLLRDLDATCVDADRIAREKAPGIRTGWQLKSLALMWSRFEQVLLLDADQVPERDLAPVFAWPEFLADGAVLWPDICSLDERNLIWEACGLTPQRMRAVESGQILVDKSRHWGALQISLFLNEAADYYYELVYGDKDLFLMGFLLSQRPFSVIPHLPFSDQPWCLFQRDFEGERLLQHRTNAKWKYRDPQDDVPSFANADACRRALQALRANWNGFIFAAPQRPAKALEEEERLGSKRIGFAAPGKKLKTLELLTFNEIGHGRSPDLSNWFCRGEGEEDYELVFADSFGEQWSFKKSRAGRWVETNAEVPAVLCEMPDDLSFSAEIETARPGWDPEGRYIFDGGD